MALTMDVTGEKELVAALHRLPLAMQKRIVRKALRDEVAKPIAAKIKADAPQASGALARSVRVRAIQRTRKGIGIQVIVGGRTELGLPKEGESYYPMAIEAGYIHPKSKQRIPAKPFVRPAFDSLLPSVMERARIRIGRELEQEWARGR